ALYPAIQHLAFLIESVLLAVDGLCGDGVIRSILASLICFAVCLEVVPVCIRLILFASILILNSYPLIGYHSASFVYIIVIIVILDQLIYSHLAVIIQPEPVVSGFLPLLGCSLLVAVVINPGAIFLYPASSCEGGHGCTDCQQGCC